MKNTDINNQKDNIESERRLLELLGYQALYAYNPNYYYIQNSSGENVGCIRRKTEEGKLSSKTIYQTEINKGNFICDNKRQEQTPNNKYFVNDEFCYEFEMKNKNGKMDKVSLKLDERPRFELDSKSLGKVIFYIHNNYCHLNYQTSNNNQVLSKTVTIKLNNDDLLYSPDYSYTLIKKDLDKNGQETSTTTIVHEYSYQLDENKEPYIEFNSQEYKNNQKESMKKEKTNYYSILEVITNDQEALNTFNEVRNLINDNYFLNKDLMEAMLENRDTIEEELLLLIPCNTKQKDQAPAKHLEKK